MNVKLPDDLIFDEDVLADVHPLFGDEIEVEELEAASQVTDDVPPYWRFLPGVVALTALSLMLTGWFIWVEPENPPAVAIADPEPMPAQSISTALTQQTAIANESAMIIVEKPIPTGHSAWPRQVEERFVQLRGQVEPKVETTKSVVKPTTVKIIRKVADPVLLEQEALTEAKRLAFTGDIYNGKLKLLHFVGRYPAAQEARQVLASWLIKDAEWRQAAVLLTDVGITANDALRMMKARVYLHQARFDDALRLLVHDIPEASVMPAYHVLLALVYQKTDDISAAEVIYSGLVKLPNAKAEWWLGLGICLDKLGQLEAARAAYREVTKHSSAPIAITEFAHNRISFLSRWQG